MPKIAVSYRRSDSQAMAGRIYDRLATRYGGDSVFMDIEKIPLGTDFRTYIKSVLRQSDLVLAIVGPRWCMAARGKNRLADPADPVRVEIEMALQHGVLIVPILVDGAEMPAVGDLPESLKDFPFLNATWIDAGRDFRLHMDRLTDEIDALLQPKSDSPPQLAAASPASGQGAAASGAVSTAHTTPASPRILGAALAVFAVAVGAASALLLPKLVGSTAPSVVAKLPQQMEASLAPQVGPRDAPTLPSAAGGPFVAAPKTYRVVSNLSDGVLNLRQREGVSADNPPIVAIPAGALGVTIGACRRLSDGEPWCPAKWKDKAGWLNARYLVEIDSSLDAAGSSEPVPDKLYRVASSISDGLLNMRRAPNPRDDNPPFASIPQGTAGVRLGPCLPIETGQRWCLASWSQYTGWVNSRYLIDTVTGASLQ